MHGEMMDNAKMKALRQLMKEMFAKENMGEEDEDIDVKHALHEAMETPEEEVAEHLGGITEEEEHEEDEDKTVQDMMREFMAKSKKSPIAGKTKAVILASESGPQKKGMMNKMGYK